MHQIIQPTSLGLFGHAVSMQLIPRLRDVVVKSGGPDKYLDKKYNTQATLTLSDRLAFLGPSSSKPCHLNMFAF